MTTTSSFALDGAFKIPNYFVYPLKLSLIPKFYNVRAYLEFASSRNQGGGFF